MALSFNISVDSASPLLNYAAGSWNPIPSSDPFFPLYANDSTGMSNTFDNTKNTGGTVSLNFVGSRVWAFGAKRSNHGFYTASVDSNDTRTFDGFAASDAQAFQTVLFDSGELPNGNHTMEIVNIGPSGGPSDRTGFDIDWITYEMPFGAPGANATSRAVIPTLVNASTSNLLLSPSSAWTQSSNPPPSFASIPLDVSSSSSSGNSSEIVQSTTQSGASVSYAFQISTSSGSGAVAMYGVVGQNSAAYRTLLTQDGQELPQFSALIPASSGGGRALSNKMLFFAGDLPAGHIYNLTLTNAASGSGAGNARRQNGGNTLQVDMVQTFASGTAASTVPPNTNANRPRPPTPTTTTTSSSATSTSTSSSQSSTSISSSSTTTSSATASATTTAAASGGNRNVAGIIVGSIFGGLLGLIIIGALVYFFLKRRNDRLAAARLSETRATEAANWVIGRPNLFAPDDRARPPSREREIAPFAAAPYPMGTGGQGQAQAQAQEPARGMLEDEFEDESSQYSHVSGIEGGVGNQNHQRSISNGSIAAPPVALAPPVHSYGAGELRQLPAPPRVTAGQFRVHTADGIREISTDLPRSNRYPRTMPLPFLANADQNV